MSRIVCPKIFMVPFFGRYLIKIHISAKKNAIEIDKKEKFKDNLIHTLSFYLVKIHKSENIFPTEIHIGKC